MGGDGKVALTCILCLGYGNYHVKSHLAIHLTSINIFMDLTIKCFKKCYKKKKKKKTVLGDVSLIPFGR